MRSLFVVVHPIQTTIEIAVDAITPTSKFWFLFTNLHFSQLTTDAKFGRITKQAFEKLFPMVAAILCNKHLNRRFVHPFDSHLPKKFFSRTDRRFSIRRNWQVDRKIISRSNSCAGDPKEQPMPKRPHQERRHDQQETRRDPLEPHQHAASKH